MDHAYSNTVFARSDVIADSTSVLARLHQAQNRHDIDAFVACFAPDYQGAHPMLLDRASHGRDQVRTNWSIVFRDVPDFQADMLRVYTTGDTVWTEWLWHGTPITGGRFDWHGITVFVVRDDHITWGHLYMEPALTKIGA
jgi:ketosteroid isomerase-like protein